MVGIFWGILNWKPQKNILPDEKETSQLQDSVPKAADSIKKESKDIQEEPAEEALKDPPSNPYKELVVRRAPKGYLFQEEETKLYGFLDKDYQLITSARYDKVEAFQNGWAIVHREGKRGYVNENGKEVIKLQYDVAWEFGADHA